MITAAMNKHPGPDHAHPALTTFASRVAVAAVLKRDPRNIAPDSLSLAEYSAAVKSLGNQMLDPAHFANYLRNLTGEQGVGGLISDFPAGDYLFAIMPTDFNGEPWDQEQLRAGHQFSLSPVEAGRFVTLTGDLYPLVLPQLIREAGKLTFASAQNTVAERIHCLQQAYDRLLGLIG